MAIPFAAVVDLDDIAAGTGGFKIRAESSGDSAGRSVSAAGDVNGDGIADVIVGALLNDSGGERAGAAYVVFGTATGFATPVDLDDIAAGTGGFKIQGETGEDNAGRSVAAAGDVNGDGLDDLIVGAYGNDGGGDRAGAAYVVFGTATGFATPVDLDDIAAGTGGFKIQGETEFDNAGRAVSAAGDVNGDGIADVIVGARNNYSGGSGAGAAYVVFGTAAGFATPVDLDAIAAGAGGFKIQGETGGDNAGRAVSAAGDVNGDGFADVIVGAIGNDSGGTSAGAAYVVFGRTTGFATPVDLDDIAAGTGGFKIQGETGGDFAGDSVAAAGDVNGDGLDDLIVGARRNDSGGTDAGAAYVVFGTATGFATPVDLDDIAAGTGGFKIQGETAYDRAGYSVSAAGDVNGDGLDDLIVGAYRNDSGGTDAGAAYVVFGTATGFATPVDLDDIAAGTGGFKIQGEAAGDELGYSVSSAGDVDGDGLDDLIVGAHRNDNVISNDGAAYIIYGRAFIEEPTPFDDVLMDGTDGADTTIDLLAGDDSYTGRDGDDTIRGNAGRDWLRGGSGDDTFELGGSAADLVAGAGLRIRHVDMVSTAGAPDLRTITGRAVTLDVLDGGLGDDRVLGTAGADVLALSLAGQGVFRGQDPTDRLISIERFELGGGDDVLDLIRPGSERFADDVTALGGEGADTLWTGSGDDVLSGEAGNDYLAGGFGDDVMTGGAGNDIFGFARGFGADEVTDFGDVAGNQDVLRIKGFGTGLDSFAEIFAASAQVSADTVITLPNGGAGGNTVITLTGFARTGLDASDFQIVA